MQDQGSSKSRWLLYALVGLVVVVLAAWGVAHMGRLLSPDNHSGAKPTLMIVSQQLLESKVENLSDEAIEKLSGMPGGNQNQNNNNKGGKNGTDDVKKENTHKDAQNESDNKNDPQKTQLAMQNQRHTYELILTAMQNSLGGSVAEAIQKSTRFRVASDSSIIDAMGSYDRSVGAQVGTFLKSLTQIPVPGGNIPKEKAPSTAQTAPPPQFQHGLIQVAKKVSAHDIILISIGDPHYEIQPVYASDSQPARVVMTTQPIINYELIDAATGQSLARYSEQLDKPIVETIIYDANGLWRTRLLNTFNKMVVRLDKAVAQRVLAWTLDKLAPAKISRIEGPRLMINRGANDGIAEGAVYPVEREEAGEALRDGADAKGEALEKVRDPVGSIRVTRVQDTIAVAEDADTPNPGRFRQNDIVRFVGGAAPLRAPPGSASAGGSGAPDVQLGSRQIDQAHAGGAHQASVAIDHILLTRAGKQVDDQPLSLAVAAALQKDHRITVLPRADLTRLTSERALNARASGDEGASTEEGLRVSGYLIDGEFQLESSRHQNTLSVGGDTRTLSTSTSSTITATLRATTIDGALVESVTVKVPGADLDAAAQVAARALLLKLFPILVVQAGAEPGVIRLDHGEDGGLRPGVRLRIYHRGERLYDSHTHALLSEGARSYSGEVVVTDVEPSVATARFNGTAFPVKVDDMAELEGGTGGDDRPPHVQKRSAPTTSRSKTKEPTGPKVTW